MTDGFRIERMDMQSAGELLAAYRRAGDLRSEIAGLREELARTEEVIGPRAADPTFMALLHMLSGQPDAAPPSPPTAVPAPGAASQAPAKAQRRSPDRRKVFDAGYALGASAAQEGRPRDLDGLSKGWRKRGFDMAYDRVAAGAPLDAEADFRSALAASGEADDAPAGSPEAPGDARAEGVVVSEDAATAGPGLDGGTDDDPAGEPGSSDGPEASAVPEDDDSPGRVLSPWDDGAAGGFEASTDEGRTHRWDAPDGGHGELQEGAGHASPSGDGLFPFDLPAGDEPRHPARRGAAA